MQAGAGVAIGGSTYELSKFTNTSRLRPGTGFHSGWFRSERVEKSTSSPYAATRHMNVREAVALPSDTHRVGQNQRADR